VSVGQRFGLLVIERVGLRLPRRIAACLCRCQCGVRRVVRIEHLRAGRTTSCGHVREQMLTAAAERRAEEAHYAAQAMR